MDITDYLVRLSRASRRHKKGRGHNGHIPRSVYRVLSLLLEKGSLRLGELAEGLDIRPASLSEQLDRMEKYGLIEKKKDESDLRVVLVSPTGKGREAYGKASLQRKERREKLERVLTEEERSFFIEITKKLIDFYESENPPESKETEGRRHGKRGYRP